MAGFSLKYKRKVRYPADADTSVAFLPLSAKPIMKSVDLTNRKIHSLTPLYPTGERSRGFVVWHCRCDCGTELDLSVDTLLHSNRKSCGCLKEKHNRELRNYLNYVCGTSADATKSKKKPVNNTSGCRGVYFHRGKYMAKIVFQKKQYYVGSFSEFEQAVRARQTAEEELYGVFNDKYSKWQAKGAEEPGWCDANPISLEIQRNEGHFTLIFPPEV